MKSEERRRLKHNELAESLIEIPDFVKEHGPAIVTGIVVVILIVAGIFWLARLNADSERVQNDLLVDTLVRSRELQQEMVKQVEAGASAEAVSAVDYLSRAKVMVSAFSELGQEGVASDRGIAAMLEEAEILMSKLHFSTELLDQASCAAILDRAEELYAQISEQSPERRMASGQAKMGLALVAENREQWDVARTLYREIAEDAEGKWTGTPYPLLAKIRLPKLDEWQETIVFPQALEPVGPGEVGLDLTGDVFGDTTGEQ